MKFNFILSIPTALLYVFSTCCTAYAGDDDSLQVRGGKLLIKGESGSEQQLLFNGKKLRDGDGYSLSIEGKYAVGNSDVVLIMNNSGGTACPVQYFFVSVTSQGAVTMTPEFGTCSDLAKPKQNGQNIEFSLPRMGAKGRVKYVYSNGVVTENGKVIK